MTANAGVLLYTEVVPRIRSAIPAAVNCVGCEDAQEVIQDGTALAAKMMHNAEHAGKKVTRSATGRQGEISAGNIAYFTIVKLRNGCRSSGMVTGDVYGAGTQINGRTRLSSLDDVVASDEETGGEIFLLHDVLSDIMALAGKISAQGHHAAVVARAFWPRRSTQRWLAHEIVQQPVKLFQLKSANVLEMPDFIGRFQFFAF